MRLSCHAESMRQIGILGGTFNPPHLGHIHAARCAANELELTQVLLIPDYLPPHKVTAVGSPTAQQRLEMVALAAEVDARLVADGCEIARGGKSYTVDTLTELRERLPEDALTFICGTDMFLTLQRWYCSETLLRLARFAVAPRVQENLDALYKQAEFLREQFGADTVVLNSPVLELSSSEIRARILNGNFEGLDPKVVSYIKANHLFGVKES